MPSSDPTSIPKVLAIVERVRPKSVLDVGPGNGRYGFLFREALDWNFARFKRDDWYHQIDCCEVDLEYVNGLHNQIYNKIYFGDFLTVQFEGRYGMVFMGDVLEHWREGDWQQALKKARQISDVTLIVSPNHKASISQGAWHGHEHETHHVILSPALVGGRCLYANSKLFITGFDNRGTGILDSRDICL